MAGQVTLVHHRTTVVAPRLQGTGRAGRPHALPSSWMAPSATAEAESADASALLPYRRLACRVIRQAMLDMAGEGPENQRESAERFLAGSALLSLWCDLAGLEVSRVVTAARVLARRRLRPVTPNGD